MGTSLDQSKHLPPKARKDRYKSKLRVTVFLLSMLILGLSVNNHPSDFSNPVATSFVNVRPTTQSAVNFMDPTAFFKAKPPATLPNILSKLLLDTATNSLPSVTINFSDLEATLQDYLTSVAGHYTIYLIDLSTGQTLGIDETYPMVPASSMKTAYNTYLYQQAKEKKIHLKSFVYYNNAPYPYGDYEAGSGIIQEEPNGTGYTLEELSFLSITISDNVATNMILRYLGGIKLVNQEYMTAISQEVDYLQGVSYTNYREEHTQGIYRSCAKDLALFMMDLYQKYQTDPQHYDSLINNMKNTQDQWGLQLGVDPLIPVAHKPGSNGEFEGYCDVGIVFGKTPYILAVMADYNIENTATDTIGEISRIIYQSYDHAL